MDGSCGVQGWLDLDFFRGSCFSYFKLLLPPSNVRRWPGQRVEKDHLCLSAFGLIGLCRLDIHCQCLKPLLSGILKPHVHLLPCLVLFWPFFPKVLMRVSFP